MARDHAAEWDALGRRDPHWAILSDPGRQGDWADDPFFAGGRAEIDSTMRDVAGLMVGSDDALDFGCGLGRLTQALAAHFTSVVGVDIAQSMVDGARSRNAFGDAVSYVVNTAATLPFKDASFDFGYSTMVLQHVPSKAARSTSPNWCGCFDPAASWCSRSCRIGRRRCAMRSAPSSRPLS